MYDQYIHNTYLKRDGYFLIYIYIYICNSFIIIKNAISSSNLLLYQFIQYFPFHHWWRLILGFTINIHRRENKAYICQNSSFYLFITSYSIRHTHFYPTQTYKKTTIYSELKQYASIGSSFFLNKICNNNINSFHQTKLITEIRQDVVPQ